MTQEQLTYLVVAAVVVVVVLVVVLAVLAARRRKEREALRARYGDEYERTLKAQGGTRAAVRDLKEREQLHEQLVLRDLNDTDRELVRRHMATLQYRFVEDPADVMLQTERVTTEVLRARGYPIAEDKEKAVRLFSVDYPAEAVHVRTVIMADHRGDVGRMRDAFLGVRRALEDVAGVTYSAHDAVDGPSQPASVERGAAAAPSRAAAARDAHTATDEEAHTATGEETPTAHDEEAHTATDEETHTATDEEAHTAPRGEETPTAHDEDAHTARDTP